VEGRAEKTPLPNDAVDITVAVTAASFYSKENVQLFAGEASRITRQGGHILVVQSEWYGGELYPVILGRKRSLWTDSGNARVFEELGFKRRDFYSTSDYGTVDRAVKTYGFIFGKKAIDYLKAHGKTTIKWKGRIYYKQVGA
jgi:hypothetical protein